MRRQRPSPTLCLLATLAVLASAQTPRAPAQRTAAAAKAGGGGRLAGSPKAKGAPAVRGRSSPPAVLAENAKACIFEFPGSTKLYYALQARPAGRARGRD